MKLFLITYKEIGTDAGPFTLTDSTGAVVATGVTREQLLAGYMVTVNDAATSVTIASSGTCTNTITIVPPTAIGYLNYPGTTHIDTWVNNNQYITTARTPTAAATIGALVDYTIIEGGVIGGTQPLTVAGPSTSLGPFNGGGTVILTANNTLTGTTTVQTGATLQLGLNVDSTTGKVYTTAVQAGGTLNVYGANTTAFSKTGDVTNAGTVNWKGTDACGQGFMQVSGFTANNGTINIDDARFRTISLGISGTGTINVADGGTLDNNGLAIAGTQTLNLNGCGWCNASGVKIGALRHDGTTTIASPINLQSDTCIKAGGTAATTFSGVLTGSATLTLGNDTDATSKYGTATFNKATTTFTGDLIIQNTTLLDSNPLAFQYSDVTLEGQGFIQTQTTATFRSLSGTSPTSSVTTWAFPVILTDNGITTYAGLFNNSQGGVGSALTIDGVGNEITLTNPAANNYGFRVLDGAKMSFTGGQGIGQLTVENGSKFTFGKTTAGYVNPNALTMTNNSVIEVQAISPSTAGTFTAYGPFNVSSGYKIDLPEKLVAGTYNIMRAAGGGTGVGQIPTIGVNNTGLTPTFSWSGQYLRVTLA